MAAIPLALTAISAIPQLVPVIRNLVLDIEKLFGKGTGPAKLQAVTDASKVVADSLSTAGKIPGLLGQSELATMAEMVVQQLKAEGKLGDLPAISALPTGAGLIASQIQPGMSIQVTGTLRITQ